MGEQLELELELLEPTCACGAELVASINAYRRLCDRCILRKTMTGHVWNEDPEPKREHLRKWLVAHGYVPHCTDD